MNVKEQVRQLSIRGELNETKVVHACGVGKSTEHTLTQQQQRKEKQRRQARPKGALGLSVLRGPYTGTPSEPRRHGKTIGQGLCHHDRSLDLDLGWARTPPTTERKVR
jgi:hypothetical protein